MSDAGRQSFTDKAIAAMKPDSQKTNTEHLGDMFKGKGDNVASTMQPQSQKSTTQKIGDALTGGSSSGSNTHSNTHSHSHGMNSTSNSNPMQPSLAQKAKNAMGLGGQGGY